MKKSLNKSGIVYFYIHFVIEVTSFFILTNFVDSKILLLLALTYDFFAFVPQLLFGYLLDENINVRFDIIGVILSSLALIFLYFNVSSMLIVFAIAFGNAMIHIKGAETTLKSSEGKISPSSIFVSGGSFGLITGKILANNKVSIILILLLNLTMFVALIFLKDVELKDKNISKFNFANDKINVKKIVFLATLVVSIRAFMGYGIPTMWNKTLFQTILLYSFMGIGKALGGILIDKIGIKKVIFISTVCSFPFLIFGNNIMYISLFGVMLFSMTMAVTLAILVSGLLKPCVAFGFTTLGLFLGSFPIFFIKINSFFVNTIIIFILTLISYISLNLIIRKDDKNV